MSGRIPDPSPPTSTACHSSASSPKKLLHADVGSDEMSWIGFPEMYAMNSAGVRGHGQFRSTTTSALRITIWRSAAARSFSVSREAKDQEVAFRVAEECLNHINGACTNIRVRAGPNQHAVLLENTRLEQTLRRSEYMSKRPMAAREEGHDPVNLLMIAGDDGEDREILRWANELGKSGTVRDVFPMSVANVSGG